MKTVTQIALAFLLTTAVFTETIYLKDGGTIQGVVKQANEEGVQIQTKYGSLMIPKGSIV